jgi:hypothetical protein
VPPPAASFLPNTAATSSRLRVDIQAAGAALAEAISLKPEVNSVAAYLAVPALTNSSYRALVEKTTVVDLRRAGFPDQ